MSRRLPIFYSALLLTAVNLILRLVGTSFQVYLSGRIGASGIGLLQLVMSVGSLSMIAGIAGIRTTAMYLSAKELGTNRKENIPWVLSGCFLYSFLCSTVVSTVLYLFSPMIAAQWIGVPKIVEALRLFAAFLPVCCLCSVMTGYFTAANRIGTLAIVEVAEQFVSMAVTMTTLTIWGSQDAVKACMCVIVGSCAGSCLTLGCLFVLHHKEHIRPGQRIPVASRLLETSVPLALADILRSGIATTENLMVPKRLSLNRSVPVPLAAFGTVSGMVFPIMMFPACILYALAELLIPELARCSAAKSHTRINYLVRRSLKFSMLYGLVFAGFLYLSADELCLRLYGSKEAGKNLQLYSLMVPMLYCDSITDAMTKGLGQQKICVRYNIVTSAMDVLMLYILLPVSGMEGYFFSFLVSHLANFLLSLRLLTKISNTKVPAYVPMLSIAAALVAGYGAQQFCSLFLRLVAYPSLLIPLLYLVRILQKEDYTWVKSVISIKYPKKKPAG